MTGPLSLDKALRCGGTVMFDWRSESGDVSLSLSDFHTEEEMEHCYGLEPAAACMIYISMQSTRSRPGLHNRDRPGLPAPQST